MQIKRISDFQIFNELEDDWDPLLKNSKSDTIFLTFSWVKAWIKNFLDQDELYILCVKNDNDELLGIAPLYKSCFKHLSIFRMNYLAFLGDRDVGSEYLDFIIKNDFENEVTEFIFTYLWDHRNDYDLLFLKEVPDNSINLNFFTSEKNHKHYKIRKEMRVCSSFSLPQTFDEYIKSLKPRFRTKIRSSRKKLQKGFSVKFYECDPGHELEKKLIQLFTLHQKKWVAGGNTGSFYKIAKRRFYRDIASPFLANNWLKFYFLEVDGKTIACQFSFLYNNRILHLQEGFDINYGEYDIGNVLRGFVMEKIIAEKVNTYDFLGGITYHKKNWGAKEHFSCHLTFALKFKLKLFVYFNFHQFLKILKFFIPEFLLEKRRKKLTKELENSIAANRSKYLNINPPF